VERLMAEKEEMTFQKNPCALKGVDEKFIKIEKASSPSER
jgi:hypothetical protein